MHDESLLPYLWMLIGSLSFALMGTLAHAVGLSCDWQIIALVRTLLCLVFVAGLALAAGVKLVLWRPRSLWLRSIAGSISLVCTFFALPRLPVSDVLTLTHLFPIWVALLSWPVLKEAPSVSTWLAVASAVLGVVLVQHPHLAEGNFASAAALVSSFSTAVAMLGLHRLQHLDPRAIVFHFSAVSLLFCVASLLLFERAVPTPGEYDSLTMLMLLGVGLSAAVGQLFLTKAFAAGSPAKVSVVGLSQVVFALGLDLFVGGRSFNPPTLLGIGLVLAPTAWVMSRKGSKYGQKKALIIGDEPAAS